MVLWTTCVIKGKYHIDTYSTLFCATNSEWSFSFKHEYESEPTRISSKYWYGGQHGPLEVNIILIHILHYFGQLTQTGHSLLNMSTNQTQLGYHQNSGMVDNMCH